MIYDSTTQNRVSSSRFMFQTEDSGRRFVDRTKGEEIKFIFWLFQNWMSLSKL